VTNGGKRVWVVDKAPTTLDFALAYAKLGWYVLPVWSVDENGRCRCGRPNNEKGHKPGKHPQAELAPHGHQDASIDEQIIKDWWAVDPNAGIGISLSQSGLLALDIDPQNGGRESIEALEAEHGVLHSDCVAITQGGGEHRIFVAEPDMTYPGTMGAGLDLKHHGYICVAPTLGPSGVYRWESGRSPLSQSRPAQPSPLPSLIASKARAPVNYSLTERGGAPVATAQTFDDLRSALKHVDADDYTTWVNVGMVLKPYGENGYKIWTEWSANSEKFDAAAQRRKWERDIDAPHSITYRSIFRMAIDNGWSGNNNDVNSTKTVTEDGEHPLSLRRSVKSGAGEVTVFEYIYDDFMSTGVNVVAGAPGVGKTTLIVPMALAAAHLCPVDYALKPAVRRNVIIITESVVQVQRVIYSLYSWGYTGMSVSNFDERVRVVSAQRLDPKIVSQVADEYRTWTVDNEKADGTWYTALPLVVFDTANAVFDLENENDNAEVGRAMAYIKQSFAAFPIIIVSHTAKVLGSGESDYLSPRGASAWTGDAQGVYTVFKDGETQEAPRVLKATKVRFPTAYPELTFDLVSNKENHKDVLGYDKEIWFSHSVARPLKAGERVQLKEDRKEQREQEQWQRICNDLLDLVRRDPGKSRSYYERLSVAQGGVKCSQERKERAIESLLNDGSLQRIELEVPKGRANHYLIVNEDVINAVERGRYGI
jgi:Bifunctional DNA primase/polymerase, N-terminal/Primase C terminal 2 (PriCT-2)/AAA domain